MIKQPILIFEGIDKSGKSSLIKEFHKKTNFKYSCIDRFSGTSYAYGKFRDRKLEYKDYLLQDIEFFDKAILIYLEAPIETLKQRFEKHKETDIELKDVEKLKEYYDEYYKQSSLRKIRIDTSKMDIESCITSINIQIETFFKEDEIQKIERLQRAILYAGIPLDKTFELLNVNLFFKNINSLKAWDNKSYTNEMPEYEMIYHNINNIIRTKLNFLKNQTIKSRQFVFYGDNCISFYQVLDRENNLEIHVTLRSSDVYKMLIADICGIAAIAEKLNEEYFKKQNINYDIHIVSAHGYI